VALCFFNDHNHKTTEGRTKGHILAGRIHFHGDLADPGPKGEWRLVTSVSGVGAIQGKEEKEKRKTFSSDSPLRG